MKKKTNKISKEKLFLFGGIFLAVIILVLAIGFSSSSKVTGLSIYVEAQDFSEPLMKTKAGSAQTYIELVFPTLANLVTPEGKLKVATEIADKADFGNVLAYVYKENPPAKYLPKDLEKVFVAGDIEAKNFETQTLCLEKIGNMHGTKRKIELVLVTELVYNFCKDDPNTLYAYAKQTFFEYMSGRYMCNQDGDKLFTIDKATGEISLDVEGCS